MPRIPFTAFAAGARGAGGAGGAAVATGADPPPPGGAATATGRIPFAVFAQRQATAPPRGGASQVTQPPIVAPPVIPVPPGSGGESPPPTVPPLPVVPPPTVLPDADTAADLDLARTLADIRGDAGLIGGGVTVLGQLVGGDTGSRISGAGGLLSPVTNAVDAIVNETHPDEQRVLGGLEAAAEIVPPLGRLVAGSELPREIPSSADVIAGLLDIGQSIAADETDVRQALLAMRGGLQVAGGLENLGAFGMPGAESTLGPLVGAEEAGALATGAEAGGSTLGTVAQIAPYAIAALNIGLAAEAGDQSADQQAVNAALDVAGAALAAPTGGISMFAAGIIKNLLATHLFTHEPSHEEREVKEWQHTGTTAQELVAQIGAAETPERLHQVLTLAARGAATADPVAVLTLLGGRPVADMTPADFMSQLESSPDTFGAEVQAGIEHGRKQPINRAVERAVTRQATILRVLTPLVEPIRAETGYPDLTLGDILTAFRERPGTPEDFHRQVLMARENRLVNTVIFPMVRDWSGNMPANQKWYTDPAVIPGIAAEFRVPEARVAGVWRTGGEPEPPSTADTIASLDEGEWVLDDNGNPAWQPRWARGGDAP